MSRGSGSWSPRAVGRTLVVSALLLLVGCTSPAEEEVTPSPVPTPMEEPPPAPAGRDIEVVLPPGDRLEDAVTEGLRRRVAALSAGLPEGVGELTVRRPDSAPFVVDLAELAASRGTGLVCVLGSDTAGTTDTLAQRHRGVRFCGLPTALPEVEEGEELTATPAVRVELPVAALGELVGTAAAEVARSSDSDAVVGLVLGGDELPSGTFRDGLLVGLAGVEVVEVEDDAAAPADAVEALLAAGAEVLVVDGHRGAREVVEAVGDRAVLLGPVDVVDGADDLDLALAYRLRHEVALAAVFDSFGSGALGEVPILLGVGDEILDLRVGAGWSELEAPLERARTALAQRDDPRGPVPDGAPAPGPAEP